MRLPIITSKDPSIRYVWITAEWYRYTCRHKWPFEPPELVHRPNNRLWTFSVPELDNLFVVLIKKYVK